MTYALGEKGFVRVVPAERLLAKNEIVRDMGIQGWSLKSEVLDGSNVVLYFSKPDTMVWKIRTDGPAIAFWGTYDAALRECDRLGGKLVEEESSSNRFDRMFRLSDEPWDPVILPIDERIPCETLLNELDMVWKTILKEPWSEKGAGRN